MPISVLFLSLVLITAGCSEDKVKADATGSTTEDSTYSGVGDSTALYLNISTEWESGTSYQSFKTCAVNSGDVSAEYPCQVSIPEGQLYFSKVKFTVGTKTPTVCPIISFTPYYYQRSKAAAYTAPGATTTIDCSATPPSLKACYGGAAPNMIDKFPNDVGYYFLSAVLAEKNYEISSENSIRWYQGLSVNYLTANNLVTRNADIGAKSYIADSMNDYLVTCEDYWAHPIYSFRLTISDEDTATGEGVQDEIDDWDGM